MKKHLNLLLIIGVIALAVVPLLLPRPAGQEAFAGADAQAETVITEVNPNYQPWAAPIFEPPSGEVESLLFALQAALGAGLVCFYIGRARGKALAKKDATP